MSEAKLAEAARPHAEACMREESELSIRGMEYWKGYKELRRDHLSEYEV